MLTRPIALLTAALLFCALSLPAQNQPDQQNQPEAILHSADTPALLPPSVFFRGQTAPLQLRNSGGIRFADRTYTFFALVDSSGYASSLRDKYQAYLLTEVPLDFEGRRLPPGAYGCGFIAPDAFVVMDIGGNDLFSTRTAKDSALHRPNPLQILPGDKPSHYRLYSGRTYVTFSRSSK
jgi:hypothetical protein